MSQLAIDHGVWIRSDLENRFGMQESANTRLDSSPAQPVAGDFGG